ncbi:hypothetical protein [Deinococcus sp.]|uniref:hypothetical protein n=1 Tax=Deinococcus sp. TaxID=47478 RepID=UPI003CC5F30B
MKRLGLLACLTPLLLAACGSTPAGLPDQTGSSLSIGLAVDDSASDVRVTRTITPAVPATATTPGVAGKTTYAIGTPGTINFVFTSRPGGNAAYITSYKVIRSSINGVNQTASDTPYKINIFVSAGYSCPGSVPAGACTLMTSGSVAANGTPSAPLVINFSGGLSGISVATNSSVVEDFDIEFYGTSSIGTPVTIRATHVVATATFNDA